MARYTTVLKPAKEILLIDNIPSNIKAKRKLMRAVKPACIVDRNRVSI